jgi:hypothetical protein
MSGRVSATNEVDQLDMSMVGSGLDISIIGVKGVLTCASVFQAKNTVGMATVKAGQAVWRIFTNSSPPELAHTRQNGCMAILARFSPVGISRSASVSRFAKWCRPVKL